MRIDRGLGQANHSTQLRCRENARSHLDHVLCRVQIPTRAGEEIMKETPPDPGISEEMLLAGIDSEGGGREGIQYYKNSIS